MAERFLQTLRRLATAYQAFAAYSAAHIRTLDLTPPQVDVLATLGDQAGMTCRELGERTLITKGTLTGVLDRLEVRGLLRREPMGHDRRSVFVALTPAGHELHAWIFPHPVKQLRTCFAALDRQRLRQLRGRASQRPRHIRHGGDDPEESENESHGDPGADGLALLRIVAAFVYALAMVRQAGAHLIPHSRIPSRFSPVR